jgi:hypothetical protein
MKPRKILNAEEYRQLVIAQRKLEKGIWSFRTYSAHLSTFVYNT